MKNGIYIDSEHQLEFVGTGQISIGEGLQLDQRFAYDYSKRPQSITRRKKKTARTATVTLQVARGALAARSRGRRGICIGMRRARGSSVCAACRFRSRLMPSTSLRLCRCRLS